MKLAILGADSTTLEVARTAAATAEHEVVWLADLGSAPSELAGQLQQVAPRARVAGTWEDLLDPKLVDAVVVASGDEDLRAAQLRTLVQVGIPLLIAHPVVDSMLIYFELDMIRRETHSVMVPYLPDRWHPGVAAIAAAFRAGTNSPIGAVEQVVLERHLRDRSRQAVRWQFARDADTLRAVCGDILRLGAMGSAADSGYQSLGVQMTGSDERLIRWSVAPAESAPWGRLSLFGTSGRMQVTMHADRTPWTRAVTRAESPESTTAYDAWDPAAAALERLEAAVAVRPTDSEWTDAARSVELMETIDRSLKRGRTIDLHNEDYSEAGTFKGLMASLGCGLLIVGLLLIMGIALAEDAARALKVRIPLIDKWPYLLVGLLAVFLMLQFLSLVMKKK